MSLVGDHERERAARTLRRHYVAGRLDEDQLSERLDVVLRARSSWDIAFALRRLPWLDELLSHAKYGLVVLVTLAVWLMLSLAMLVAFIAWVVANGATLGGLIAFPAVWIFLSALLYRHTKTTRREHQRR
jgi:uncharacterized protein DUF1707